MPYEVLEKQIKTLPQEYYEQVEHFVQFLLHEAKAKSRKSEDKNKISIYPFIKSIFEFYENIFSDKLTQSFFVYLTKEESSLNLNQNIDILLFNKTILLSC